MKKKKKKRKKRQKGWLRNVQCNVLWLTESTTLQEGTKPTITVHLMMAKEIILNYYEKDALHSIKYGQIDNNICLFI